MTVLSVQSQKRLSEMISCSKLTADVARSHWSFRFLLNLYMYPFYSLRLCHPTLANIDALITIAKGGGLKTIVCTNNVATSAGAKL
ncbi:hypothetical protein [Methanolobus psychrotolerans]|uniref:hypothetical protein n=1 Tax=Methanolobus psychrotolerans TaxID=1874706 RepID=UPI001A91E3C5|nr:hypothetical protein [Methanolobus psychrotolerans]